MGERPDVPHTGMRGLGHEIQKHGRFIEELPAIVTEGYFEVVWLRLGNDT